MVLGLKSGIDTASMCCLGDHLHIYGLSFLIWIVICRDKDRHKRGLIFFFSNPPMNSGRKKIKSPSTFTSILTYNFPEYSWCSINNSQKIIPRAQETEWSPFFKGEETKPEELVDYS